MAAFDLPERWLPALARTDPEIRWRSRLVAQSTIIGLAAAVLMGVVYASSGLRSGLLELAIVAAALVTTLLLLRRRPTHHAGVRFGLAATTVLFAAMAALERTLDGAALMWLGIVPYLAVALLGRSEARWWLAVVVLLLIGIGVTRWLHLLPVLEEAPGLGVVVARTVLLVISFFTFAWRFEAERQRAVAELEQANRAKSAFLANMSHEIRTPMNSVLGMTEVLLQGPLTGEQREQLKLISRSGRALIEIINDVLDMSKIEAGKLRVDKVDFDLHRMAKDLELLFAPVAHAKDLELKVVLGDDVPAVLRGDALKVRQVLSNLLNNALKFTEAGNATLEISRVNGAAERAVRLRFSVADTGIGIPPEVLPRLFTAFEQGDASTTRRFGGTGLGLALSKQLVALLGGTLAVETKVKQGSRFSFELELEPGVAALLTPEPDQAPGPPLAGPRLPVLVVDDNPFNLKVACSLVEKAGYRAVTAVNGREALAAVQREPFTLVLMDCHMPDMDGFEATEKIRALDGEVALVPIVALTASAMPEEVERCTRAGMNECLTKPVSLNTLTCVLTRIERYRSAG